MKNKFLRRIHQLFILAKFCCVSFFVRIFCRKNDSWLLSERGDEARDNAFSFYKFLKKKHPEIKIKYVLTKDSQDIQKINKSDIAWRGSIHHIYYYLCSKNVISTHIQGASMDFKSFSKLSPKFKIFRPRGHEIMLQHGITKDYMPSLIQKNNPSLDLLICGANPEYDYIDKNFGYRNSEVRLTGFARFDYLESKPQRQILIMPTWRTFLFDLSDDEFMNTDFYREYNSFLNSKKLKNILKSNDYKLIFYPHYEIQKRLHLFKEPSCNSIIFANKDNYDIQRLLCESDILITDYSSVAFDFAYMEKPVLYFQFDYDKYRKSHYAPGYYDYNKHGFGPVVYNTNELISKLENMLNNPTENIIKNSDFFNWHDRKNCARIFNAIKELDEK